jgi:hypothetical protein
LLDGVAAFAAWLGISIVVLSEGRRGIAAGIALATVGLSVLALPAAGIVGAVALFAGGAIAAVRRALSGPQGWGIMPAGSTPRLVLCVAAGVLGLWVGLAVMQGGGGALRFAVMVAIGLGGARLISSDVGEVAEGALSVLALTVGVVAGLAPGSPGVWPYLAAAVVAAAATSIPIKATRAA